MDDILHKLHRLGFGDYEARAYVAILKHNPVTGYELAKVSGIPRANIYDILPRLEERGAVVRIDTESGARYSAVSPSELMPRLSDRFNDDLAAAQEALAEVGGTAEDDYTWNVESRRAVIDHARTLIDAADRDVLVAILPEEAGALAGNLSEAEERGVSITTLCLAACAQECGGCRGNIHRYRVSPEENSRWLVVTTDGREMLSGEIRPDETAYAVRTTHPLLVELGGAYIRNSVAVATVVSDLGDQLLDLLSVRARTALATLGQGGLAGDWLRHTRELLMRPSLAPVVVKSKRVVAESGGADEPMGE